MRTLDVARRTAFAALVGLVIVVVGSSIAPPPDNAVKVLVDAEEVFPAVLDLIRSARHEALVSVYILGGSEEVPGAINGIGRELVDALVERQQAGVRVRVLTTRFVAVKDRRQPGTFASHDVWLHPVFDYAREQGIPILRPRASKASIDHSKYIVVDGREAIFGGMNLADAVASNHDMMVQVAGPVAEELQRAFAAAWADAAAAHGPDPRSENDTPLVRETSGWSQWGAWWDAKSSGAEGCDIQLVVSTPDHHKLRPSLVEIIEGLRGGDQLQIAMLLFTDRSLRDAVIAAHKRRVTVSVLVDPESALYGVDCLTADNASTISGLAKAGVPLRFYRVEPGQEMHMKVFVATSQHQAVWGVGSANWAGTDMDRNSEVYGLFRNCRTTTQQVSRLLSGDFDDNSVAPTAEQMACFESSTCRSTLRKACGTRLKTGWLSGRK